MGNPLRNSDPEAFRLITLRTTGARLWITPNASTRKLIGGIIARYQEILRIEIYAYCILGNHYHLLIKAPHSNTDEFLENVNREISRRMNWRLRREGQFWGRRYAEQIVLTEEDALEALLYINTNPTRHGLLADSSRWPGLTSFDHALKEKDRRFSFTKYSAPEGEPRKTTHSLKLTALPQFQHLRRKQRRKELQRLLEERMEQIAQERGESGQGFMGLEMLQQQLPGERPEKVSRSPRPVCYTRSAQLWRAMRDKERKRRAAYAEASFLYRLGCSNYDFPDHCYLPPRHRLPRIYPFVVAQVPEIQS